MAEQGDFNAPVQIAEYDKEKITIVRTHPSSRPLLSVLPTNLSVRGLASRCLSRPFRRYLQRQGRGSYSWERFKMDGHEEVSRPSCMLTSSHSRLPFFGVS